MRRLWLTASGGPFRKHSLAQLRKVTREEALRHPTWKMGPKVTIDSATLMNKGLEIMEPCKLETEINNIPGVLTVGIFANRPADVLLLGTGGGVETRTVA